MKSLWFGNAASAGKTAHFSFVPFRPGADACGGYRLREGKQGGRWPGRRMSPEASAMPFEISDEGKFYSARLYGVLDRADLNAVMKEVERLEDAGLLIDRITDLTALDRIDVGFEEVFAIAARRADRRVIAPIKSALVANRPVQFGFARMFQMLNDNPRIQIQIFGNLEEAQQWLHAARR
jgi:hypothetical protein